jgi:hypothetical protein
MPVAEFEPTIAVFKRAKTFHPLDRAATVTGWEIYFLSVKLSQEGLCTMELVGSEGESDNYLLLGKSNCILGVTACLYFSQFSSTQFPSIFVLALCLHVNTVFGFLSSTIFHALNRHFD